VYSVAEDSQHWYGDFYTPENSVTIPSGLLQPGNSYVFILRAMADARANMSTSPWRSRLPMADGSIVSGPLTVEGEVIEPTVAVSIKAAKTAAMSKMPASLATRISARKLRSFTRIKRHEPIVTK
jgi:hypothetical protein